MKSVVESWKRWTPRQRNDALRRMTPSQKKDFLARTDRTSVENRKGLHLFVRPSACPRGPHYSGQTLPCSDLVPLAGGGVMYRYPAGFLTPLDHKSSLVSLRGRVNEQPLAIGVEPYVASSTVL